jgi:hypothetical protein
MTRSLSLESHAVRLALWLDQNPQLVRVAVIAIPVLLALALALFGHDVAYAYGVARTCPVAGQGPGGGT